MFTFWKNAVDQDVPAAIGKSTNSSLITNGIIVSTEGRNLIPTPIDTSMIQQDRYIPLKFAESKLEELHQDRLAVKEVYEKRLEVLTQHYEKNLNNTKSQYESFIMEVKGKAERHIELQRSIKQKLEENFRREVSNRDFIIEELRDNAAAITVSHQNEIRAMKSSLKESELKNEMLSKSLNDSQFDRPCIDILHEIVSRVENTEYINQLESSLRDLEQCKLQYTDLKRQYDDETIEYNTIVNELRHDLLTYRECSSALTSITNDIEVAEHQKLRRQYSMKIFELNNKMDTMTIAATSHASMISEMVPDDKPLVNPDIDNDITPDDYRIRLEIGKVLTSICQRIEVSEWNMMRAKRSAIHHNIYNINTSYDLPKSIVVSDTADSIHPILLSHPHVNIATSDALTSRASFEFELLMMRLEDMESRAVEKEVLLSEANKSIKRLETLKRHLSRTKLDIKEPTEATSSSSLAVYVDNKASIELHNPDDMAYIEQLEDQLAEFRDSIIMLKASTKQLEDDKLFIQHQLDNITKEKRTDLIVRFEEEIEAMKNIITTQSAEVINLRTEKQKALIKNKELTDRVNIVEKEIKDRDAAEIAKLSEKEEKHQLKSQIVKQRDEIVMKAKAATAGWDAAASSDEKLDSEVDKAYQRGLAEGRIHHKDDMASLNTAIEKKEERLTALVVQLNAYESKVRDAELNAIKCRQEMEAAKQETADTVLMFTQFSDTIRTSKRHPTAAKDKAGESTADEVDGHHEGDGDADVGVDPVIRPSSIEFESLREILDQSQDEVLELVDKLDSLQDKLNLCEQRTNVFEQLLAVERQRFNETIEKISSSNAGQGRIRGDQSSYSSSSGSLKDLQDLMIVLKASLVRGGALWKSNKKDECYDLYMQMNTSAMNKLSGYPEYKKLFAEAAGSAKALVTGKSNQKAKAAMILKKAMEKFILLAETKLMDSDGAGENVADGENNMRGGRDEIEDLNMEVRDLQMQLAVLNSLYNNTTAEKASVVISEEKGADDDAGDNEKVDAIKERIADGVDSSTADTQIRFTAVSAAEQREETVTSTEPLPTVSTSAIDTLSPSYQDGTAEALESAPLNSLLRRAKEAESNVDKLKRQLALMMTVQQQVSSTTSSSQQPHTSSLDGAEIRRLTRRIKELEAQIQASKSSSSSSHSSDGVADKKALAIVEKQLQKKIKDLETAFKKERNQLESRAIKAEKSYETTSAMLDPVTKERDLLRIKTKDMMSMNEELTKLRKQSEQFVVVSSQLDQKISEYIMLSEQFKKEAALRKKYKNELEDIKGAIRVFARCRPMAQYEIDNTCKQSVVFKDEMSLKLFTNRGERDFEFDSVFHTGSTQEQVFEDAKRLVESCIDGFNVCIFAYGQTGSGKTFTMTGSAELPGLTPKSIQEIFTLVREKPNFTFKISTYFVELYNDNLVDLYWLIDNRGTLRNADGSIVEPPKLDIKLDARKMVMINNVVVKEASNYDELMGLFEIGNAERHVGSTKMNATSSRSHSIFAIMVESYDPTTKRTTIGKLSLVDLAGSERADKTGASGNTLKEAQSINKSLSALGNVIAALSEGEKHIPYRSNKLTQLMQDSLGGNAKTLMFVNFSPADYNVDETYSSLNYAARVKKIVNNASKQAESEEVARLKQIIKRLQGGQVVAAADIAGITEPVILEDGVDRDDHVEGDDAALENASHLYDNGE